MLHMVKRGQLQTFEVYWLHFPNVDTAKVE